MAGDWASEANPADPHVVAQALDDGRLALHGDSAAALQALGLTECARVRAFLAASPTRDPWVVWRLRRLATERRASTDRLARSAQLVWSGERTGHQPLRDTRAVLDEVCARAERSVLLATYNVVYDGRRSLAAIARRMREVPSLQVDFSWTSRAPKHQAPDEVREADAWLRRFRGEHWPEDVRLPAVWYDPSTLDRSAGVSLHAKCVVVGTRAGRS